MYERDPRASAQGHAEGAKNHDQGECPANAADPADDRRPPNLPDGKDEEPTADGGDEEIEKEAAARQSL